MWGTHGVSPIGRNEGRFIPTHVGNTPSRSGEGQPRPVHPHACGEHNAPYDPRVTKGGSSPRMWGTRIALMTIRDKRRFIPTHVGNTQEDRRGLVRQAVHPHACGEHPAITRNRETQGGSSPRMWGTRLFCSEYWWMARFIPTHVGNTLPVII